MKSNYLLIYFLLLSTFGFAQNYDIGGVVNESANRLPLPGVNVQVKNSSLSTMTDFDGKFSLKGVATGSTLVFSYLGYKNTEYKVSSANKSISINLQEDVQSLEQVVVIGYGSQKKKEVTGSVSVVDSRTLSILKPVKIEQALQGTVSGVNVTTQSGAPGAALDIRIRGVATNGNNAPLTIIDGYIGELGLLNPNDVESITVLKDAQAAIYGSIGANGVILITTKTGKKNQKMQINYNAYTGLQETSRKLPMLNATQYAAYLNESYANSGRPLPYANAGGLGKGTDWQSKVFDGQVPIINHDISITGGSEKITYAVSGSHLDQEGIVGSKKSGFLRNTARISLGADLTDRLKINTNVIYTNFNRKSLNENGLGSVLFNALNSPSTLDPYNEDGTFSFIPSTPGFGAEIINPLAQIDNTYNSYNFKKINGNFGFDYKLSKSFTVSSSIGFNSANSKGKDFAKQVLYSVGPTDKVFNVLRSSVTQRAINDNSYTYDLYGTYKKSIAEKHNIEATVGTTVYREFGNGLTATGFDVPNNSWDFADISLTRGLSSGVPTSAYNFDERRFSLFARLQYNFDSKYFLSAMLRRDTSTKFGPNNRVAYFPSFTAGWIGLDDSSKLLSFLKIRASYGTLGNDQIKPNGYISLLNGEATYVFDGQLTSGQATGQITNPNVKWEEARKFDVGTDIKLFNNKVSIVADYFSDTRHDLLIQNIPVSAILGTGAPGASAPTVNAGTVRNSGVEFAIDYKTNLSENFSISLGYNVTLIKNKVLKVNNETHYYERGDFGVGQQPIARMQEGLPIGYFYGYRTDGIFQNQAEVDEHPSQVALGAEAQPGDIRFVDVNGDGVIDTKDRTNVGDPIPSATMGFNLNLNYKGFDFVAYTFASVGNDMVRNYERNVSDANRLNYVLNRWTGEGTSNTVPRATTTATSNTVFSDYYVEDASYLRIQNVQLGYSVNPDFTKKAGISKVRLYVGVNNLYTFTKYMGYDPGASIGPLNDDNVSRSSIGAGIDYGFYPIPRTYLVGLNVNF